MDNNRAPNRFERADGHNQVVFLSQTTVPEPLRQHLESDGWTLLPYVEASASSEELSHCRVGLVQFDTFDLKLVRVWEEIYRRHSRIQWLALVNRAELGRPGLRELIFNCFYDFHTLPVDYERLRLIMGHAYGVAQLKDEAPRRNAMLIGEYGLVGLSQPMLALRQMITKAARADAPVLISGESGTGKELVAAAIHAQSARKGRPYVAVNCASLPGTLIQSELFGYEKGAFTGANAQKLGRIESAAGGTLFLDEIGDLDMDLQVTLLRFLQEKSISRIGNHAEIPIDVRVIAATHINLEQAVEEGQFREDLYYRLNVVRIHVPPLRDRLEDIPLLAQFFFGKFQAEKQPRLTGFSMEAMSAMRRYRWPGNVRELINRIRHAMALSDGKLIVPADLGLKPGDADREIPSLDAARGEAERRAILDALDFTRQNMSEAARLLGVTRATLYRLVAKHQIGVSGGTLSGADAGVRAGGIAPTLPDMRRLSEPGRNFT